MISSEVAAYFEKNPSVNKHFMGVYSIDTLPNFIPVKKCLVVNLSKSYEIGSHWISLIRPHHKQIEIFDSLGTDMNKLTPYLHFNSKIQIEYNMEPFQKSSSSSCGYFAVTFLYERLFNLDLSFKELLSEIFSSNLEINEKTVIDFCDGL